MNITQTLESLSILTDSDALFCELRALISKNFTKTLANKDKIISFYEESEIPQRKCFLKFIKKLYEKYSVYLTRPRLEIATVIVIVVCAGLVFLTNLPKQGVLKLDNDAIIYDGSLVRGKMNGQGTVTFSNGDTYTGEFSNGAFNGKGTYQAKAGWVYEGDFVNGQAEGKGKLTTEQEVVYEGDFKQGLFQQAQ